MLAVLPPGRTRMVVGSDGAALIGVSGRAVATIVPGEEVTIQGERGPYTIVHWDGRDGYIMTSQLLTAEDWEAVAQVEAHEEEAPRIMTKRPRFNLPWRRIAA